MTPGQKVAQLLMTATSSSHAGSQTLAAIRSDEIGSVILNGHSSAGQAATKSITRALQAAVPSGTPPLFVSTDQEGGQVQDLHGPGFDEIPSGVQQGQLAPATLKADATRWAGQLKAAGVNLSLGPVFDTVPSPPFASQNPPIGGLDRQYGYTPQAVTSHGLAAISGMAAAGIDATAKHFPGLGRVTGNTDTTAGVTDAQTTADDPYLDPFAAAVKAGVPFVMMSTAIYSRIDPSSPAAFSAKIVTDLLRQKLGFDGVVISDDVGGAEQVSSIAVGQRAVRFVNAGGDIVLTVDVNQVPTMRAALLSAMHSATFSAKVDTAVLRVLIAKAHRGLLH